MNPEDHYLSRHALVQTHEPSQRTNLYIAHHGHRIEGLPEKEGQDIIRQLLEHATNENYKFEVEEKIMEISSSGYEVSAVK